MDHRDDTFIGGRWVAADGQHLTAVTDPSTETCVATVREAGEDNVDQAVRSAAQALPALRYASIGERVALLRRLADELTLRAERLADVISSEMGTPRKVCVDHQVKPAVATVRTTADVLDAVGFTETVGHSDVIREPVGVVAAITPWNYPLLQTMSKLAPAIAAGCPVVLKPSELAPLDAYLLAEAVEAADLPPGSFNLVVGTGPDIGESLVRHPGVAMVSLTGSIRAGRRVAQLAAAGIKRVALELGGKSPAVVLADADLEAAIDHTVDSVMVNAGQTCTALTRLLVPMDLLAEAEERVATTMARYRVGPAADPASDVGPLANAGQLHRVTEHLERAPLDGARTVWAYPRSELPRRGLFVSPHAFTATDPRIAVAQEEVFGPVLTVIPYVDEADAIAIANGTRYGLAATVWSGREDRARAVAERIVAGTVDLNGAPFNGRAPFGGHRQSGLGRELGVPGILEFTELKSIQRPTGAGR